MLAGGARNLIPGAATRSSIPAPPFRARAIAALRVPHLPHLAQVAHLTERASSQRSTRARQSKSLPPEISKAHLLPSVLDTPSRPGFGMVFTRFSYGVGPVLIWYRRGVSPVSCFEAHPPSLSLRQVAIAALTSWAGCSL